MKKNINIDPYLAIIDNDDLIQGKLQLLANDAFNNNESLITMRHRKNEYLLELAKLIKPVVELHKDVFLNEDARSFSSRLNYPHICFLSKSEDIESFICNITNWLIICLTTEKQKNNEGYVCQLLKNSCPLPNGVNLAISKEGLINFSGIQDRAKLLDHAIDLLDGRRIYLHQFLRRHFNSNFVDIPRILNFAMQQGLKVEVRVDPFRIGDMSRYCNIMECDAWFGPRFDQRLLDSKDKSEKFTVQHFNGDNPEEKMYNQYVTIFRTSMLDANKGFRQFFVEEYPPYLDWVQSPMAGVGEKYVIQRFAHFVYDQNAKNFEHVDCAVRIFNRDEYDKFYEKANHSNDPGGKIGERFKLFKISGGVSHELIERSLYSFFRGNIHLVEYFNNLDFSGAVKLIKEKQMKRAALKKEYDRNCPY